MNIFRVYNQILMLDSFFFAFRFRETKIMCLIGRKIQNEYLSSQNAHSVFYGLSNILFLLLKN